MLRVQAFIDGFNLYHSIDSITKKDKSKQSFKWLNLRALMEAFIQPSKQELKEVFYFTAYATWLPNAMARHKNYVQALTQNSVTTILGNFKKKQVHCHNCQTVWNSREEKESDVNVGIHLVKNAYEDNFDIAFLVTSDSDMVPVIKMIHETFPNKRVIAIIPTGRYDITKEIQSHVQTFKIKEKHLKNSSLPDYLTLKDGSVITKPIKYQ